MESQDTTPPLAPDAREALKAGTLLGDSYEIVESLGEAGPHAITYRARPVAGDDEADDAEATDVAVKELFPRTLVERGRGGLVVPRNAQGHAWMADARRRVMLDAQLLEGLEHPGLPRVRARFEEHGTAYVVTDLVPGELLHARLQRDGRLPVPEAMTIALALLDALEALHAVGLLHRDLAPANVLLAADGRPVLLGLCSPRHALGVGSPRIATPRAGYSAIEVYGSRGKGPWTDVYAAAAVLYAMVTGHAPPSAVDRAAGEPLPHPVRLAPGLPAQLDVAIVGGLALRPEDRPHGAERFRTLLEEALAEAEEVRRTPSEPVAIVPADAAAPAVVPPPDPPPPVVMAPWPTPLAPPVRSAAPVEGLAALRALAGSEAARVVEVDDDEDAVAVPTLALDPSGFVGVALHEPEVPSTRRALALLAPGQIGRRWVVGGLAAAAVVAVASVQWRRSRGIELEAMAPAAAVAPVATRPTPPPPDPRRDSVAVPVTAGGDVRLAGAPAAASAVVEREEKPERERASRRTESREERRPATIELPRITVPVVGAAGVSVPTEPMPPGALEQLRDQLASARARVDAGDFAGAQSGFRAVVSRLDELARRHVTSPSSRTLRAEAEASAGRAREACAALNAVAQRRSGRIVACG